MPLLNLLKTSAQVAPSKARRLATMFRIHSSTQPWGCTYFHRAAFLLPMVVSRVTCVREVGCHASLSSEVNGFSHSPNLLWYTPLRYSLEKSWVGDTQAHAPSSALGTRLLGASLVTE